MTTLGGVDAENYQGGRLKSQLLPVAPKKLHNGVPQLHLADDQILRWDSYLSLRDVCKVDYDMLSRYDHEKPAHHYRLTDASFNLIADRFPGIRRRLVSAPAAATQEKKTSVTSLTPAPAGQNNTATSNTANIQASQQTNVKSQAKTTPIVNASSSFTAPAARTTDEWSEILALLKAIARNTGTRWWQTMETQVPFLGRAKIWITVTGRMMARDAKKGIEEAVRGENNKLKAN